MANSKKTNETTYLNISIQHSALGSQPCDHRFEDEANSSEVIHLLDKCVLDSVKD
jgi:hypothetical protein